jgi:hypothetical protein
VRKYGALKLDFEIFIPVKILDGNSQVCFHRCMITAKLTKANHAQHCVRTLA